MSTFLSRFPRTLLVSFALWALFALVAMAPPLACAGDSDSSAFMEPGTTASDVAASDQNYSGLAELVTMICEDALERFRGFYGPSDVMVFPFSTIGFYEKNRQSELGVTLADQMVATINNETTDHLGPARGDFKQELRGVLQEVDGYLRVHLSGINAAGQRTSFVVIVEMSEPIYRALHTYL